MTVQGGDAAVLSRHARAWHWGVVAGISIPKIVLSGGLIAVECVSCGSAAVTDRPDLTAQGYHRACHVDCIGSPARGG
jgi:hypothetical protein